MINIAYCIASTPSNPWSSNRYEFVYMQMSHHRHCAVAPTCLVSTHSGRAARRSLGLLVTLLLLELPELGLDGDRRLLGLRVFHVDVKVLGDVRLGRICKEKKDMMGVKHSCVHMAESLYDIVQ